MTQKIAIIRNPVAGRRNGPFYRKCLAALEAMGAKVTVYETRHAGHATEIARNLAQEGAADIIVAAGGDGTIREVAEGVYGSDVPVGVIPVGTANVLARELGLMPFGSRSPHRVAAALRAGETTAIYPFEVVVGGQPRIGLCWLGAGFDGAVLERVSPSLKEKIGRLAFVPATLGALATDRRASEIHWYAHGGASGVCGWAVIANIAHYAGPFVLTRQTAVDRPGLACLFMAGQGGLTRAADQMALLLGRLGQRAHTEELTSGPLTLGGPDTPIQLDGDLIGLGPVTVRPLGQPVHFIARR